MNRVAAGVSDRDMLREFGMFGALIVSTLIIFEVTRVMEALVGLFEGWSDSRTALHEVRNVGSDFTLRSAYLPDRFLADRSSSSYLSS